MKRRKRGPTFKLAHLRAQAKPQLVGAAGASGEGYEGAQWHLDAGASQPPEGLGVAGVWGPGAWSGG